MRRPDPKPYEPSKSCRQDYFLHQGVFLNWHKIFVRFTCFLRQAGFDELAISNEWEALYNQHLRGWTTNYLIHPELEKDFITEKIKVT